MKRKSISLLPTAENHVTKEELQLIQAYRVIGRECQELYFDTILDCAEEKISERRPITTLRVIEACNANPSE